MKYNFKKYQYLGAVIPEVPNSWEPAILDMLIKIDKLTRPKIIPLVLLNLIYRYPFFLTRLLPENIEFFGIKQKFGSLKITGVFPVNIKQIITETEVICNDTCEYCGNRHTIHVMVKSWVRNLCTTCKEQKKYGTNN